MNKVVTSKQEILSVSKEIALESGIESLNIRTIAQKCGVSIGSIYNYFPTKSDLVIETIKAAWIEILQLQQPLEKTSSFITYIQLLFDKIKSGSQQCPAFFSVHALGVSSKDKSQGRQTMDDYFVHLKKLMLTVLQEDKQISDQSFSESFSKEAFVDFIFNNLLTLLVNKADNCDFLIMVIKRILIING